MFSTRRVTTALAALACGLLCHAASAAPPAGCTASASGAWPQAGKGWTIEALASGPDCEKAAAMIVIRDAAGIPQWTAAHRAEHVALLSGQTAPAGLQEQLKLWIDPTSSVLSTSRDLPDWPAGADGPGGEFPFLPAEGTDRESYMQLRASGAPVFCYVQGVESLNCVALEKENGTLAQIGYQLFPG